MLKRFKRAGVWALAVAMAVTMTPASAFATDTGGQEGAPGSGGSDPVVQEGETPDADAPVLENADTPALTVAEDDDEPAKEGGDPATGGGNLPGGISIIDIGDNPGLKDLAFMMAFDWYGTIEVDEDITVLKGLFKSYDGTDKWGDDVGPKQPVITDILSLVEGTDFQREYCYCRDGGQIKEAFMSGQEKKKVDGTDITTSEESSLKFVETAKDMTQPGYILERISGKGTYSGITVYVLHFIMLDMTIKADDVYKCYDPDHPAMDPIFTYTRTFEIPETIAVPGYAKAISNFVYVTKAQQEESASTDPYEPVKLLTTIYMDDMLNGLSYMLVDYTVVDDTANYRVANFTGGMGNYSGGDEKTYIDAPINLTLLPGKMIIEDTTTLPASEGRVAKQLEATELVSEDGKYTTTVKMSLPFDEDTDLKAYYDSHNGPNYAAPKQNEAVSTGSSVVMKLSSDFKLPLDSNGELDLSKLKLKQYQYHPGAQVQPTGEGLGNLSDYMFNSDPVTDGATTIYDFKGYKLDDEDLEVLDADDAVMYGFDFIPYKLFQTGPGSSPVEVTPELVEKWTHESDNFAFTVTYFPTGLGEDIDPDYKAMLPWDWSLFEGPCIVVSYTGAPGMASPITPQSYISFEFEEELAEVSTEAGTHGKYDRYGTGEEPKIKVLASATLVRVTSGAAFRPSSEVQSAAPKLYQEKPEAFFIPTVEYTVEGGNGNNGDNGNSNGNGGNGGSNSGGGRASGGGGASVTPVTVLPEPEVPLAETPELNKTDHVAYVIGYEDGTVKPENLITRAEVATIFYRLLTDDSRKAILSSTNSFKDTVAGAWYNKAVSTLTKGGILSGYTDGTFLPSGNITRAEFATIAARFDTSEVSTANVSFKDISGHWAEQNIKRAAALGYITGYEDGSFKPNEPITRAEAMTMLNRVLGRDKITADGLLDTMSRWSDCPATAWYYLAVQEATNTHEYTLADGIETWTAVVANPDWSNI